VVIVPRQLGYLVHLEKGREGAQGFRWDQVKHHGNDLLHDVPVLCPLELALLLNGHLLNTVGEAHQSGKVCNCGHSLGYLALGPGCGCRGHCVIKLGEDEFDDPLEQANIQDMKAIWTQTLMNVEDGEIPEDIGPKIQRVTRAHFLPFSLLPIGGHLQGFRNDLLTPFLCSQCSRVALVEIAEVFKETVAGVARPKRGHLQD